MKEICQSPALFPSDADLAHAKQGLLGDCWFLSACTFLVKNQHLLNKVHKQYFFSLVSCFRVLILCFVFCAAPCVFASCSGAASRPAPVGQQQVQGVLPVRPLAARPLDRGYCRRPPPLLEFLALLLTLPLPLCLLGCSVGESVCQVGVLCPFNRITHEVYTTHGFISFLLCCAFLATFHWDFCVLWLIPSRLHGSYEQLWAGQVSEALVDLTASVAERWSLRGFGSDEEERRAERNSDEIGGKKLDLNLLRCVKEECALSCSTHSTPRGQRSVAL